MADCPICSKGTVLEDRGGRAPRRAPASGAPRRAQAKPASAAFSGPSVSAGPFEDADGVRYEVRLEKVPGGLRLAEWAGSQLRRRAPELPSGDLMALLHRAGAILTEREGAALAEALAARPDADRPNGPGVSRGRSGDFKEELRVEEVDAGRLRVARWVLRPGAGWQLQDAPPMLPPQRFTDAVAGARRAGLLSPGPAAHDGGASGSRDAARP